MTPSILSPSELPRLFVQSEEAPSQLYFSGDPSLLQCPLVSVVGAREVKSWVLEWMENELGPALHQCGVGVVSGGARGLDQYAHGLAIRGNLPTVVVVPSGLQNIYPKKIENWRKISKVLFVSEYLPAVIMRKHHFHKRNRIIAGLSPLTLVVQASEKSGTMMTARKALDYGRALATLPGSPLDSAFAGNNQLLYDGAFLIRNKNDLVQLFQRELKV